MTVKSNIIVFSFILLITGFLVSLSFQSNGFQIGAEERLTDSQWQAEAELRDEILAEQHFTRELAAELNHVQDQVKSVEEDISDRERTYFNLVEDVDRLRMVTGAVGVKGEGVRVTLSDAAYIPGEDNPNDYIVHEQHIQQIIDELFVAGAEAVSVNGHRINHNSYIQCVGPVIEVDGYTSFAPFEITAIGDKNTLEESLNLAGGVKDQLVSENIQVRIASENEIELEPYFSESGEGT